MGEAKEIAYDFAQFYERREEDRWALADLCVLAGQLPALVDELSNNFGISVNLQTLKNYARVSKGFGEEHRHPQYKWSNYLEWSRHEDPIKAMETALDHGYSPSQMARLRRYGDPEYRVDKVCEGCGKALTKAHSVCEECLDHADEMALSTNPEFIGAASLIVRGLEETEIDFSKVKKIQLDDEGETGGPEQRDQELESTAEDRPEAVGPSEEVQEQGKMG